MDWLIELSVEHDLRLHFWFAVIGGTIIKVLLSELESVKEMLAAAFIGIFVAWLLTGEALNFLSLDPVRYETIIAAALALTSDHIARGAFKASKGIKVEALIDTYFRGKTGGP